MEYKKEKVGTGRFSHLILKNSKIIVDINFDENLEFLKDLACEDYETFLLYPGENSINLSTELNSSFRLSSKKMQFIIIDGTWPCAKKMVKLSTVLHSLPRVSFNAEVTSQFTIKHQPQPGCLSTVESIYQLLKELNRLQIEETLGMEENLIKVFSHTVRQQIELASDPEKAGYRKKPFSLPSARKISKKWAQRLIFFKN
jgi:DTW domain-containing protein YfiP